MNPKKKAPAKKRKTVAKVKSKTVEQWLGTLPEPYRTQALSQIDPRFTGEEEVSLSEAIMLMVDWEDTAEGFTYWNAVDDWACGDGELPEQSLRKPLEVGGIFIIPPPPISTTLRRVCGYLLATAPITSLLIVSYLTNNPWIGWATVVAVLMVACVAVGVRMIFD